MADAELLGKLFDKADKDGDGTLSKSEIQEIFKVFDTAGSGKVSKESFLSTYQTVFGGSAENAEKVFTKLDKDGSGDVTAEELFDLFGQLDTEGTIDWYLTIIAQAFAFFIKESTGKLTRDEFITRYQKLVSQ
ncbi:hypothetical protein NP493_538g04010 [Ridgeia piscesae]|uniref:EF-hand domain-containing protein n=1 Tax=Ridgeia piscesae TaxID=27915 RepID=A0AAD9NT96_RIDPI|nr:hypothetical protein NP493_538g04010 [Ridgeia piscesae]